MSQRSLADTPILILAGGLGTRLRAVVADRPKALAPVGGEPFLEIQLRLLARQGARHFVLCVGHRAEQLREHFGDGRRWGWRVDYSVEQGLLLGTAGALKLAERFFAPRAMVLNGDTYLAADYAAVLESHLAARDGDGALATLVVSPTDDATRYGTVLLDPAGQRLTAFREKLAEPTPGPAWVSAGVYVIERELLAGVPQGQSWSLERDLFPPALAAGATVAAFRSAARFYDIGTPEGLRIFDDYYAQLLAADQARCA